MPRIRPSKVDAFRLTAQRVIPIGGRPKKDKAGTGDVIIPIPPTDPTLTAGRRYSIADFLAALRPSAERAIADTDPLKGG